jgi:hypothetical protein
MVEFELPRGVLISEDRVCGLGFSMTALGGGSLAPCYPSQKTTSDATSNFFQLYFPSFFPIYFVSILWMIPLLPLNYGHQHERPFTMGNSVAEAQLKEA